MIGDGIVEISVLQPTVQRAEVTLHIGNGEVATRIEIEEKGKAPAFPEDANDAISLVDGDKGEGHSGDVADVIFEHHRSSGHVSLSHDLKRDGRRVYP